MNQSSDKPPKMSASGTIPPDQEATSFEPINVDSILKIATDATKVNEATVENIFARINEVNDSTLLIYRLLKNFLTDTNPGEWLLLSKQEVPRKLLTKLCLLVEIEDLSNEWNEVNENRMARIQKLIREFTPNKYETGRRFLKERKMLPLALIIFRHFRNSPAELRIILSKWLEGIAQSCQKNHFDPCEEAQRAAKWLIELSAKKSNPNAFRDASSAVTLALRGWEDSTNQKEKTERELEKLLQKLTEKNANLEESLQKNEHLEARLKKTNSELAEASQVLKKRGDQLAFSGAQANASEEQALGKLKQQLKQSITSKTEDIRLFLDRKTPNIQESLNLIAQIEQQFD